ncbi:unnamed protein product [Caenorhabditis auriculariae]|uniref:Galectin domain-containing protein n=1 Tax=Caenorhabditis auriculariae TaxID=2777116 RepID=A0A8S1GU01_9PELO|nr:unnamed protein product [Caenorhabditis auriculariae]
MLVAIWFSMAFLASAQRQVQLGILKCSPNERAPMTELPYDGWPKFLAFDRPLKHGDWVRFSFTFRNDDVPTDATIDFRKYDRGVRLDKNIITLHMRFKQDENRLVINAHDEEGKWQNYEQSHVFRSWWLPGRTAHIEVRYHNTMFEIYERTVVGYVWITDFRNIHEYTEYLSATNVQFFLYKVQHICYGDDPEPDVAEEE